MFLRRTLHAVVVAVHAVGGTLVLLQALLRPYDEGSGDLAFDVALTIVAGACLGAGCCAALALGRRLRSPRPRDRWLWSALVWPAFAALSSVNPVSRSMHIIDSDAYISDLFYFLPSPLTPQVAATLLFVSMMTVAAVAALGGRRSRG